MKLSAKERAKLKSKAMNIKPVVWIGKKGINENIIKEIVRHLKKDKLIKVKILRSAFESREEKHEIAERIAMLSKATLVEVKGNTVVLYRRR